MAHTTEKIIDKIKELKGTVLPSGKLILFGSQARRDATTDSDWDMLLLLNIKENNHCLHCYPNKSKEDVFGNFPIHLLLSIYSEHPQRNTPIIR